MGILMNTIKPERGKYAPIKKQRMFVKEVLNDKSREAFGITRLLQLFLVSQIFFFPSLYIKQIVWYVNYNLLNIIMEAYIVFKIPFACLYLFAFPNNRVLLYFVIYFGIETILYVISLLFLRKYYQVARYPTRSFTLLIVNFLEITMVFACVYFGYEAMVGTEGGITSPLEAIYFSIITFTTIGYGDYKPAGDIGIIISIIQSFVTLLFASVAISYFVSQLNDNKLEERK